MMAESDKKRFDVEMANYNAEISKTHIEVKKKKMKKVKDPNAPKRNLTAFFFFSNEERAKVKEANPEFGIGDIAKEIGKRWADIDPNVKSRFEKLAEDDKARYEKEKGEYEQQKKNGVVGEPAHNSDSE